MSVRSKPAKEMGAQDVALDGALDVGVEVAAEVGDGQLRLLPGGSLFSEERRYARPDWQLDERTRSVGREGVAQAREALRRARSPEPNPPEPIRKAS